MQKSFIQISFMQISFMNDSQTNQKIYKDNFFFRSNFWIQQTTSTNWFELGLNLEREKDSTHTEDVLLSRNFI